MKKVFIKYNPYKLGTEIDVDGEKPAQNSALGEKAADGNRLQEWVEELPGVLVGEYNDKTFEVTFHGALPDYEDIKYVFEEAERRGELTAKLEHKPARETADKEKLIDKIFQDIQQGPVDGLRDADVRNAFASAKSGEFEVCVVATMSAGKSTLINAMLRTKLMPSKQGACTAIITRVKDCPEEKAPFQAAVYDKEGKLRKKYERLELPIMESLNADEDVSEIRIVGNIPFVTAEDVSLVLIDTPGPNNSQDERHKKVQSDLLGNSSKALILYVMTGEFGTNDDNDLLRRVADSMSVGGKQSKDRFIFVVNKLDGRKKEDGDTNQTLERVRAYLKTHGIANPNLFPAAALPALNIRLIEGKQKVDEDTIDEAGMQVRKLNRNADLHFEKYATLPLSIRWEIDAQLARTRADWDNDEGRYSNPDEALIHTGVISIERAIQQYVRKYAKTAKIRDIANALIQKLEDAGYEAEIERELAGSLEDRELIVNQIAAIRQKRDAGQEARKFKAAVDGAMKKVNADAKEAIDGIVKRLQEKITERDKALRNKEFELSDAKRWVELLAESAKVWAFNFETELNRSFRGILVKTVTVLLDEYQKKLASLTEDMPVDSRGAVAIDPLRLISGSVAVINFPVEKLIKEKVSKEHRKWVVNTDKAWFKPWTWLDAEGWHSEERKSVQYITGSEISQVFLTPIEQDLYDNGDSAYQYAMRQSERITAYFQDEFKRLDDVLERKLTELANYVANEKDADARVKESEYKLVWLRKIKAEVEAILEI
ncbi:MAG: dynamin family protein [Peptococcaceae bacterium]|jgi:GTPase Era involved in 16S rRNA processing|nr:dynamin family protein [Peptococcaceae bacterium]